MNAAEMQTWLEESDPETSAFEISRESFTELVKYMQTLTAELTSAKEEIERLKYWEQFVCERCRGVGEITVTSGQTPESFNQENVPCPDCVGPIIDRAESAESLLSAERKETERLRYELNQIFGMACDAPELNMSNYDVDQVAALNAAMIEIWKAAKAALQERQDKPRRSLFAELKQSIEEFDSQERQGEEQ